MQTLLLSAVADRVSTDACRFEVGVDGGGFQPADTSIGGPAQFEFDDSASFLDVSVTPHSPELWPVTGRYQVVGPGELQLIDAPDNFAPPVSAADSGWDGVLCTVYLSRLREATGDCVAVLANVPPAHAADVTAPWPPGSWDAPEVADINVVADPPLTGNVLSVESWTVEGDSQNAVFERCGTRTPRLIAVSWPNSIGPWSGSIPTPFLVYFHANMGQNVPAYYTGPYPFDFDYVFYGLWNYLNYRQDPLTTYPFSLGLPYQAAVSQRSVVLVLPCSSSFDEVGSFLSAADMATTLSDLQSCMFRRAGLYDPPPGLGRAALAGFSGANGLIASFLSNPANLADSFVIDNLREVYSFEAPDYTVPALVAGLAAWAVATGAADTAARIYRQGDAPALAQLVPPWARPGPPPFVATTPDDRWTLGVLPATVWQAAAAALGHPEMGHQFTEIHHMFASMMLVDALRRSSF